MTIQRFGILIVCVLTWVLGCSHSPPPPPPKVVPQLGARVELAAGNVWVVQQNQKLRVITGAMLETTSSIVVGSGARALIRLGNGTGIFIRGDSEIALNDVDVLLKKGEIWVDVPGSETDMGRFVVNDVHVTASGAGFDILRTEKEVKVYVARGLAVVAGSQGRTELASGELATVGADGKPMASAMRFWDDWTGGMADRELMAGFGGKASGRIYGIDRQTPGAAPKELQIQFQEVTAVIREGVAHTTVDQQFFNPANVDVEGWYWFTIPEGAAVERFALETNGQLIDGEMTERQQAAAAYEEAVQKAVDPALLEWVDGRTFRARIFPIAKASTRRVVLSYTQFLPLVDGVYRYVYPMGGEGEKPIQEFSLQVDLGDAGKQFEIATQQDARVSDDSQLVTMRRTGFLPQSDFMLELTPTKPLPPLRTYRYSSGMNEADFVMLRYSPKVDFSALKDVTGDVVVIFDTSAGGGAMERQIRTAATEAILRALSAGDRFAIVTADLQTRVLYPQEGLSAVSDETVSAAMEQISLISSAGASDLGDMFNVALKLVHGSTQPAVVYVGDGQPTVGEMSAQALAGRLRRSLGDSHARLFTLAVGENANHPLMESIARVGGGQSYRIDTPEQIVQEALRFVGKVKTPTITDLKIDAGAGLDQRFSTANGKVTQGEEVVILARSHHALPKTITVSGSLDGKPFSQIYKTQTEAGANYGYIPSLWARMYLSRLQSEGQEANRGTIVSLGLNYALMTPYTSFLILESDEAYAEAGIERRERHRQWLGFNKQTDKMATGSHAEIAAAAPSPELEKMDDSQQWDEISDEAAYEESVPAAPPSAPQPASGAARSAYQEEVASPSIVAAPKARRQSAGAPAKKASSGMKKSLMASDDDVYASVGVTSNGRLHQFEKGTCSDGSTRPLSQRRVLWSIAMNKMSTMSQYAAFFFAAGTNCELPSWEAQKQLLSLIAQRATSPTDISALLYEFTGHPKYLNFLKRIVLRRTFGPDATMSLLQDGGINWFTVRAGLQAVEKPADRVAKVRELLKTNPEDPSGRALLIDVLLEAGQTDEAMAVANRLRRDELAGPLVLATLCDLQAEAGWEDDARRTCSELVEYNPDSPDARALLGDLFLRHGWFDAAYRQYSTLVEMNGDDPISLLRLAIAAAGMGKEDEALRIERKVAAGDGEIGPTDPRRFARLLSAVKLAAMLEKASSEPADEQTRIALERALKRIWNFTGASTMTILVWHDFEIPLSLSAMADKTPYPLSDSVQAQMVGLQMIDTGPNPPADLRLEVKMNGPVVRRPVPFTMVTIRWDGTKFQIRTQANLVLKPGANSAVL